MIEMKQVSDTEIHLLRVTNNGSALIACITGENMQEDARILSMAFNLRDAAVDCINMMQPEGRQDESLLNNLRAVIVSACGEESDSPKPDDVVASASCHCSPPFVVEYWCKDNGPYHWEWAADAVQLARAKQILTLKRKAFPKSVFRLIHIID